MLRNKVIVLTGGSSGIGLECAKAYVAEGAKVVILSQNKEEIAGALTHLKGAGHMGIEMDLRSEAEVATAFAQVLEKYARLDAIHNNAGIAHPSKPLHITTGEEWEALMQVNIRSILFTTRYGLDALVQSKGAILNTSSLVGDIGQENHAAYAATKGAVNALTKSMALDYASMGVRVNAVAPAGVWTPMLRKWNQEQADPAAMEAYLDAIHPLGYCPEGDVVADACVFLLSEKARFITGTILNVTGAAELGYRERI